MATGVTVLAAAVLLAYGLALARRVEAGKPVLRPTAAEEVPA